MADMDPQPCAVDEQVDRLVPGQLSGTEVPELLEVPGQRCVIGDGKLHLQ
jgi:hypothetical protein